MSTAADMEALLQIHNPWNLQMRYAIAHPADPLRFLLISYRRLQPGRMRLPAAWQIADVRHRKTTTLADPYYRDQGMQTYVIEERGAKPAQLANARLHMSTRYHVPVDDWVRFAFPGGGGEGYVRTVVADWVREQLRQARRAARLEAAQ